MKRFLLMMTAVFALIVATPAATTFADTNDTSIVQSTGLTLPFSDPHVVTPCSGPSLPPIEPNDAIPEDGPSLPPIEPNFAIPASGPSLPPIEPN